MLLFNHESYFPVFKQRILSIHTIQTSGNDRNFAAPISDLKSFVKEWIHVSWGVPRVQFLQPKPIRLIIVEHILSNDAQDHKGKQRKYLDHFAKTRLTCPDCWIQAWVSTDQTMLLSQDIFKIIMHAKIQTLPSRNGQGVALWSDALHLHTPWWQVFLKAIPIFVAHLSGRGHLVGCIYLCGCLVSSILLLRQQIFFSE